MYAKVISNNGEWSWVIYNDGIVVGLSARTFETKEACRQDIRAIRNGTFLIYDEQGQVIAASWPFM